jgi:GntR family transcriptional regulator
MSFQAKIQLDFRSNMPIYLQIVEQLEQMLLAGELKPGDQLPTMRQLASDIHVNFNTVARSYRLLNETGLISTQQGRGTYILDLPDRNAVQRLRQESLEVLTGRFLFEISRLGISADEACREIEKQMTTLQAGAKPGQQPEAERPARTHSGNWTVDQD